MEVLDLVFAELDAFTSSKRKPSSIPRSIRFLGNVRWLEHLMRWQAASVNLLEALLPFKQNSLSLLLSSLLLLDPFLVSSLDELSRRHKLDKGLPV